MSDSVKCGSGAVTFRKCTLNSFFFAAKYLITSTGSAPVAFPPSSQEPTHRQTPMFGLSAISMAFLYPSKLLKIHRGTPASIRCGGSSG